MLHHAEYLARCVNCFGCTTLSPNMQFVNWLMEVHIEHLKICRQQCRTLPSPHSTAILVYSMNTASSNSCDGGLKMRVVERTRTCETA